MNFKLELLIDKNIEAVWDVMGNQFGDIHLWASNFKDSKVSGKPKLPGVPYLHRVTETKRGVTIQELNTFDPVKHTLSYDVTKGVPKIAKKASGIWSLSKVGKEKTKLNVHFILQTKGILGFVLTPIIKVKIGRATTEIGEELKYYMETGEPHPRKIAAQN